MVLICLDPGHGGSDPGAAGNGLVEADLTLFIAQKVAVLLQNAGAGVVMTRTGDYLVELNSRAELANRLGADYFQSIHINSGGGTGLESYTMTGFENTQRDIVHAHLAAIFAQFGLPNRGKKQADFAVLRETSMPSNLVELGFIDNPIDAGLLANPSFKDKISAAIAEGLIEAFSLNRGSGDKVDNAVLIFGIDDIFTGRRLAQSLGDCAIFFRKPDGSAPADVRAAAKLYIVGGSSVGHPNEKILSGANFFRTADVVGQYLGQ